MAAGRVAAVWRFGLGGGGGGPLSGKNKKGRFLVGLGGGGAGYNTPYPIESCNAYPGNAPGIFTSRGVGVGHGDRPLMARSPRDRFDRERERVAAIEDGAVREAVLAFADALDPEVVHVDVPKVKDGRIDGRKQFANSTARNYLKHVRSAHERGLDLLGADADTVNDFMQDVVSEPARRRHGLVDPGYTESISKVSASAWQAALRMFYRFCAEPGARDDRPEVAVPWSAVDGSHGIRMYADRPAPSLGEDDLPGRAELDAMREACLAGQNTRRDRAFLELAAGTGQRVYALVTLLVGDVRLDGTADRPFPHVYLNAEIRNDGDKGAIDRAGGRLRPLVSDPRPVREWLRHHPLRDPDVRAGYGAPKRFEDCYLFVGALKHERTDPTDHWSAGAARGMLERRRVDTASMPTVATVTGPVNPHVWRSWAYTRSKALPLDESDRRKMFGWAPGSDTGERIYDRVALSEAAERYADAWSEAFGDDTSAIPGVAEQVVGEVFGADLSPEVRQALARELLADDAFLDAVASEVAGGRR